MAQPQLTDDELRQIRAILAVHNAENAVIEEVDRLPPKATWIGRVGRFGLWLFKNFGLALTVLLIPTDVTDAYKFWWPKAEYAFKQVSDFANEFDLGNIDPRNVPPTSDFIAFNNKFALPPAQPPIPILDGITVVASSGVSPDVIAGSGEFPFDHFYS